MILDQYLHTLYNRMLAMYYQSPESIGRTDENAMRAMPWAAMMTLFKKAYKIEDLEYTAKFQPWNHSSAYCS